MALHRISTQFVAQAPPALSLVHFLGFQLRVRLSSSLASSCISKGSLSIGSCIRTSQCQFGNRHRVRRVPFEALESESLFSQPQIELAQARICSTVLEKGMAHAIKPSVDLEGGESVPIARRPSTLATRPARASIITEGAAAASPASPTISIGPSYSRPSPWLQAPAGSENHFTTLPPSPPTRPIGFPSTSARYLGGAEADYPTPPASVPGSAKAGSGFSMGLHGVTVVVDDGRVDSRQSSSSEGEESWNEGGNTSSKLSSVPKREARSHLVSSQATQRASRDDHPSSSPLRQLKMSHRVSRSTST